MLSMSGFGIASSAVRIKLNKGKIKKDEGRSQNFEMDSLLALLFHSALR